MTQLSQHFSLEELTASQIAVRLGRKIEPPGNVLANLGHLSVFVLEPIRARVKRSIFVLSGYRPPWLNLMAGGSKTSDHMDGCAADIRADGMTVRELASEIVEIMPLLPIKQVILEFDSWVHVSVSMAGVAPKRQVLTARRGETGTVYLPGLQLA